MIKYLIDFLDIKNIAQSRIKNKIIIHPIAGSKMKKISSCKDQNLDHTICNVNCSSGDYR